MPSKFSSRISWREKLTRQQEAKIVEIPPRMRARVGKGKMLIPKPLDVDALIRRVPKGKMATVFQLREELARRSKVDVLYAGEFLCEFPPRLLKKNGEQGKSQSHLIGA